MLSSLIVFQSSLMTGLVFCKRIPNLLSLDTTGTRKYFWMSWHVAASIFTFATAQNPFYIAWNGTQVLLYSWEALCGNQSIIYTANMTADSCLETCRNSTLCQFISFDGKTNDCGLVPRTFDCVFRRVPNGHKIVGGPWIHSSAEHENTDYDAPPLVNGTGFPVIHPDSFWTARAEPHFECPQLCNFHPRCKIAVSSSWWSDEWPHFHSKCVFLNSTGPVKTFPVDEDVVDFRSKVFLYSWNILRWMRRFLMILVFRPE